MRTTASSMLASTLLLIAGTSSATEFSSTLAHCAGMADHGERLACFDTLAASSAGEASHKPPVEIQVTDANDGKSLSQHWELDRKDKRGVLSLRPHQKNYILIANHTSSPNEAPFSQLKELAPDGQSSDLMNTEVKYQLSLKTKVLEDLTPFHVDIWGAYTQQSNWQAYNHKASSPFRDTNYQPEVMAVVPLNIPVMGMHARFINFGIIHQSNGQALTLSRSWDRVYAQIGLEGGDFSVLARVWKRRHEDRSNDDNPDILDYMGHGDIVATYRHNGHEFSLGGRRNVRTKRGAIQADWAFPLAQHLKGYMQAFSGYGQSLIDYNHRQTTFGLGVLFDY